MHFTAHVHGRGLVDWPAEAVDAYADDLLATHQPTGRWVPGRQSVCRRCAGAWPCQSTTWAVHWQDSLTRSMAGGRGRYAAR